MRRHPIDPISCALGLIVTALGVLVAVGQVEPFEQATAWWIAVAATLVGLALIPWGRLVLRTRPETEDADEFR